MTTPFLAFAFALFASLSLDVIVKNSVLLPARVRQRVDRWKKAAVALSFSMRVKSSCRSEYVYGKQCAKNYVSSEASKTTSYVSV